MGGLRGAIIFFVLLTQSCRSADAKCILKSDTDGCFSSSPAPYSTVTGSYTSRSYSKSSASSTKHGAYSYRYSSGGTSSVPGGKGDDYSYAYTTTADASANSSSHSHANATMTMEMHYTNKTAGGGDIHVVKHNSTAAESEEREAIVNESHIERTNATEIETVPVRDSPKNMSLTDETNPTPSVEVSRGNNGSVEEVVEGTEASAVQVPLSPPAVVESGTVMEESSPVEGAPKSSPVIEKTHEDDLEDGSAMGSVVSEMLEDSMRAVEDMHLPSVDPTPSNGVERDEEMYAPATPPSSADANYAPKAVAGHSPAEPKFSFEPPAHFYPCGYPKPIDPNDPKADQTDIAASVKYPCQTTTNVGSAVSPAPPLSPSPVDPSPVVSLPTEPSPSAAVEPSSPAIPPATSQSHVEASPSPPKLPLPIESPAAAVPSFHPPAPSVAPTVRVSSPSPAEPLSVPALPSPSPVESSPVMSPPVVIQSPCPVVASPAQPSPLEHGDVLIVAASPTANKRQYTVEESKALATDVKEFISSGNVTALAELVIESDDIYGLNMGFRFDEEDRSEELAKTADRESDKDVVALKALASAALDPIAKNKVIQLMVLVATAPDGYHFTEHRSLVVRFTKVFSDDELLQKIIESNPQVMFFRRRMLCSACTPVRSYVCAHCWPSQICNVYFWCGPRTERPRAATSTPETSSVTSGTRGVEAPAQKSAGPSPAASQPARTVPMSSPAPKKTHSTVTDAKSSPNPPRKHHGNRRKRRSPKRKGRKFSHSSKKSQ